MGEKLAAAVVAGVVVEALLAPFPERLIVSGLLAELSKILRVPVRVPFAVGEKITPMVQILPARGSTRSYSFARSHP